MDERGLAVFAKAPVTGQVKTRLVHGATAPLTRAQAARLYRCFLLDTLERAQRVPDCRVILFWTPLSAGAIIKEVAGALKQPARLEFQPQSAGDLGVRMDNSFRELFARGIDSVVLIGGDLPTLPASRLTEAFNALERKPVVLGPAMDGGYYLVGLRAPQPALFTDIAWSTPQVMAQTIGQLKRLGLPFECLEPWYDVDTATDLEHLICELKLRSCRDADLPEHTVAYLLRLGKLEEQ